jgi:hypothetical protein
MVSWLEKAYILTSMRPCPFSQGLPAVASRSGEAGGRYLIDSAFSGKPDFAVVKYENSHDLL